MNLLPKDYSQRLVNEVATARRKWEDSNPNVPLTATILKNLAADVVAKRTEFSPRMRLP